MSRPDGYLLPGTLDTSIVVKEVARGFRVTVDEIMGPSREPHITIARACAMAVVRQWTNMSFSAIGRLFNREHTTVMYHVHKVMADPDLARGVALVIEELSPSPTLFAVDDMDEREAG